MNHTLARVVGGVAIVVTSLLAGTALLAFGSDGTPDVTYGGGDGVSTLSAAVGSDDLSYDSALQSDGKVISAGLVSLSGIPHWAAALARFTVDGTPDPIWGVGQPTRYRDGLLMFDLGPGHDIFYSVAMQPDKKVLAAGVSANGASFDFVLVRLTPQGALDPTFGGGDGKVVESLGSLVTAYDIAVQADGKILVVGSIENAGVNDFLVTRYTSNGTLDTSFAGTGRLNATFTAGDDVARSVTVMPNGRIVVAGTADDATVTRSAIVVRLMPNGTYDATFGNGDGYETITALPAGFTATSADSVVGLPSGQIVIGGMIGNGGTFQLLLARFTPAGIIDLTFGEGDGLVVSNFPHSSLFGELLPQSDGKLVASGTISDGASNAVVAIRYSADGVLDTSFDLDGMASTTFGGSSAASSTVAIHPNGRITLVGSATYGTEFDFGVARFDARSTLRQGATLGPRVLLGPLHMTIAKTSRISLSVDGATRSKCSISRGKVKGKAPGLCRVRLTVRPKKTTANPKPVTTKVTVVLRVVP